MGQAIPLDSFCSSRLDVEQVVAAGLPSRALMGVLTHHVGTHLGGVRSMSETLQEAGVLLNAMADLVSGKIQASPDAVEQFVASVREFAGRCDESRYADSLVQLGNVSQLLRRVSMDV